MDLKDAAGEWLEFRIATVTRRLQYRLDKVQRAAAHPRRPADRLPEPRRSDPHRAHRGRAQARPDEALQAVGRAGRGDPRDQAAPPGAPRGDEDPRRAGGARGGARRAREDAGSEARLRKLVRDGARAPTPRSTATSAARRSSSAPPRRRSTRPSSSPASRSPWCCRRRLGARGQGPRDRPAAAVLQDRRRLPGRGPRTQHAAGGVRGFDRAQPTACPRTRCRRRAARASRCRAGSTRRRARASRRCSLASPTIAGCSPATMRATASSRASRTLLAAQPCRQVGADRAGGRGCCPRIAVPAEGERSWCAVQQRGPAAGLPGRRPARDGEGPRQPDLRRAGQEGEER